MARIGLHGTQEDARGAAGRAVDGASDALRGQARRHSQTLVRFARAGYTAKGIVYLVIGAFAALAAAGAGGGATDSSGALRAIGDNAGGRVLLLVMGVGLMGYALWAAIASALDAEDRGHEPKGLALRIGLAVRGLFYGALGLEAVRLSMGAAAAASGGSDAQHWTARLLQHEGGRWVVMAAGLGVIGYALYQLWVGARKNLRRKLHIPPRESGVHGWVMPLARFGIVARGVVFGGIGWLILRAGMEREASRAGGIAESLATLSAAAAGPFLPGAVAIGLMAYGVWQLANARYREFDVT